MLRSIPGFHIGLALLLTASSTALCADEVTFRNFDQLRDQIKNGEAEKVFHLADAAVERDHDNRPANILRWYALVAIDRPDEAQAGLVRWADRNRSDPFRADELLDFFEKTKRWDQLAAMTSWLALLPEPGRARELRSSVDRLCKAGQCGLASASLWQLMPKATEQARLAVVRALEATSRRDIKGMVAELPLFPEPDQAGSRVEARILVSRRAAAIRDDFPPTGGQTPEAVSTLPVLIQKVDPVYPDLARRARIEGKVIVRALVLPSGETIVTGILGANNPMFIDASADAVAQWTYQPGTIDGKPIAVDYVIRVDYRLGKDSDRP